MKLQKFLALAKYCLVDKSGQFALGFALLMPLLFGLAGGAVDFIAFERNMRRMQDAADHAALAAAREGSLQGWNEQIASEVALTFASENLGQTVSTPEMALAAGESSSNGVYRILTSVDMVKKSVTVRI